MTFYKRHKILSAIFFISIILLIKNSSIPYIFEPPAIISYIFDSPKSNFWDNVAQMSNIFTSAYVTSLMFYYMVCKLRSNGMPVPLLRNGYSIFNGTKYR